MARKRAVAHTAKSSQVSDSKPRWVKVRVAKSFDLLTIGEEFQTELTDRAVALVAGGFLEVTEYGPSETGPGPAVTDDQGGEPEGTEAESPSGSEPGEDPGAR